MNKFMIRLVVVFTLLQPTLSRADKEMKDDAKQAFQGTKKFVKDLYKKTKKTTKKVVHKVDDSLSDKDGKSEKKD